MADFPNLNMSIGEYYKMLIDGKRPTRQRTAHNELPPALMSQQPHDHPKEKEKEKEKRSEKEREKQSKAEEKEKAAEEKKEKAGEKEKERDKDKDKDKEKEKEKEKDRPGKGKDHGEGKKKEEEKKQAAQIKDPEEKRRIEKQIYKQKQKEGKEDLKKIKGSIKEEAVQEQKSKAPTRELKNLKEDKSKKAPPKAQEIEKKKLEPSHLEQKAKQNALILAKKDSARDKHTPAHKGHHQIQTSTLSQHQSGAKEPAAAPEEDENYEHIYPHPHYFEGRLCLVREEENEVIRELRKYDKDAKTFSLSDPTSQAIENKITVQQAPDVLSKVLLCRMQQINQQLNPSLFGALYQFFEGEKLESTQNFGNKGAWQNFLLPIVHVVKAGAKKEESKEEAKEEGKEEKEGDCKDLVFKTIIPKAAKKKENMEVDDGFSECHLVEVKFREIQNAQKNFRVYETERFTNAQNRQYMSQLVQLMTEKHSHEDKDAPQPPLNHYFQALDTWCSHLNQVQQDYLQATQGVILTKENMSHLLFSLCKYESYNWDQPADHDGKQTGKQKYGVLLRVKYDPYYQEFMLMFRLLLTKQFQRDRVDWIQLSKHRVRADLTKGFLAMSFIQDFENAALNTQKIKVKHLKMASWFETEAEKRSISDPDKFFENFQSQGKKSLPEFNHKSKCEICSYTTVKIASLKCSTCSKLYHHQCLQKEYFGFLGMREELWRCMDCLRCTNCLSTKNRGQMINCNECNSPFHYDCLDQNVKLSVPYNGIPEKDPSQSGQKGLQNSPNKSGVQALSDLNYRCENCIFCQHCGAREAGKKKLNKWSKDFQLCSNCNKKKKRNQFCPVCERFWHGIEKEGKKDSMLAMIEDNPLEGGSKPALVEEMMYCGQCKMWVHNECDRMLASQAVKDKFINSNNNDLANQNSNPYSTYSYLGGPNRLQYSCSLCRQHKRTQLLVQLVDNICLEDKYLYFQEPVEDKIIGYTKIVKNPMCFRYVKEQIPKLYLRNPEQMMSDIGQIFKNAKIFNQPKHKVHKDAIKLDELSQQRIQSVWPTLQKYKLRTLDEDTHSFKVKKIVEADKRRRFRELEGLGEKGAEKEKEKRKEGEETGQEEPEMEEYKFCLKPEELFDNTEHQPLSNRQSAFTLSKNELLGDDEGNEGMADDESLDQTENLSISKLFAAEGGITGKNLRTRKNINYNEDRLLNSASELGLSGQKRLKVQKEKEKGDDESSFSNALYKPPSKRAKKEASETLLSLGRSGIDLLQQAIQQQQKQEQINTVENIQNQHIQQQQQMLMNYYQDIDDEKCYYANPIRCSFDDPCLIFEEMCYLCGSFGNKEDFLSCTLCGESFHTYCLALPHDDISKFQSYWKCLNCKFCEVCSQAVQENLLLYCDVCDKAFHSYCLQPRLDVIPNCGWKCQECFKCQRCGGKQFFSEDDISKSLNKQVSNYRFSNNFAFCYQCGINEYKKSFCNICNQKSEGQEGEEAKVSKRNLRREVQQEKAQSKAKNKQDLMLKCSECNFYSHLRCSRVSVEAIEALSVELGQGEKEEAVERTYKCLNCLLSGKTINHLIRESCEHYENIHQIISRQKLLAQICTEILNKYFPIQEKAPLFINKFVDQNQEFFRSDGTINEWLGLLETNVCFEAEEANLDHYQSLREEEDQDDKDQEARRKLNERINERELGRENAYGEVKMKSGSDPEQINILMRHLKHILVVDNEEQEKIAPELEEEIQKLEHLSSFYEQNKASFSADQVNQLLSHTQSLLKNHQVKSVIYRKWNVDFSDLLEIMGGEKKEEAMEEEKGQELAPKNKKELVQTELYAHKETFLPPKRNLYKSLFYGDLYRQKQRELFMEPQELRALITVPTEENLRKFASVEKRMEDLVAVEFKAVMKIKLKFFKWFEELMKLAVNNNLKFMKKIKKKSQEEGKGEDEEMEVVEGNLGEKGEAQENVCTKLDEQLKNPQNRLQCILCKFSGELVVTGRLLPFQINQFVHANCALWSTDVFETEDGQLVNFFFVYQHRAQNSKCSVCGEYGATIYCFSRKCNAAFHFPCAYRNRRVAFLRNKETYCDGCSKQKDATVGYLEEYTTFRRLYIVKNNQPYMTNAFQIPGIPPPGTGNVNPGASQEGDKPFQIEKWRPFYYDMFNRVGNLTVLSLKKEINQIIDEVPQGQEHNLSDFATVRIYWRFYQDKQLIMEDPHCFNPSLLRKGYFLYSNNQIREVHKQEFETLIQFASDKVRDKVQWAINVQEAVKLPEPGKEMEPQVVHNQTNFWNKIFAHFQRERPNFCLKNIEFSIQEFAGKTKYPISIWNRAEIKNKNFFIKSGYQQLSILCAESKEFGQSSTQLNFVRGFVMGQKEDGMTQEDIFKNMLKMNAMGGIEGHQFLGGGSKFKQYTSSKHMKYDQIMQQLGKKIFHKLSEEHPLARAAKDKNHNKKLRVTDSLDQGNQYLLSRDTVSQFSDCFQNKQVDLPIAMKYRMSKTQPKVVEVGPSKIHRNGLFTLEDLNPGDIVIEYVGEKIRNKVADKRELIYELQGIGDCYLFRLDKEVIIDATFFGNKARYLNHSCDANCSAKTINVKSQKHIIISANRAIKSGEELTYNYNFDIEAEKLDCFCGAHGCTGRLN